MSGELRFDRLTGQWVNISAHRQSRPNLPSTGCPFCVGGLEAPEPYDTKAFVNRWPAFVPGDPVDLGALEAAGVDLGAAVGASEVILYSPVHDASLASLGWQQVRKVVDLWAQRSEELLARPEVEYALVFESRGAEVGATIHHPHGQIYAFGFTPPAALVEAERTRHDGGCVVCAEVERERGDGDRVLWDGDGVVAWVPYASAHPYGVNIVAADHLGRLGDLDDAARDGLARALTAVLSGYENLWADDPNRSEIFPYLMWFHQEPSTRTGDYHLHVHLAPPQRAPGVSRFIAAGEVGSGTMSNPVAPEAAAQVLRDAMGLG